MKTHTTGVVAIVASSLMVSVGLMVSSTTGHERYDSGCNDCHGAFTGPVSPSGTVFPNNDKHFMHRNADWMNTECDLCHTTGDGNNPFIGSSDGTPDNPGVGCTGCHGRDYPGIGNSGVGLRAHHVIKGVAACLTCHPDDPEPMPENILPTYYGTFDTSAFDPCNAEPLYGENFSIGDTRGLDNDGDDLYDAVEDPDCGAVVCLGDLDGSGDIGFADLLALLSAWGACPPDCPEDLDDSGDVGFGDLLIVLSGWGPCP